MRSREITDSFCHPSWTMLPSWDTVTSWSPSRKRAITIDSFGEERRVNISLPVPSQHQRNWPLTSLGQRRQLYTPWLGSPHIQLSFGILPLQLSGNPSRGKTQPGSLRGDLSPGQAASLKENSKCGHQRRGESLPHINIVIFTTY